MYYQSACMALLGLKTVINLVDT